MSQIYFHTTVYVIVVFLLMQVALTACGGNIELPPGVISELEAEIFSREPSVENYEISTIRTGAHKKLPSSVVERWCVEITINSNGQSTNEHYMIDQKGESFECKQLTEDQLTFLETGCYW
jgi:hypothetical protein